MASAGNPRHLVRRLVLPLLSNTQNREATAESIAGVLQRQRGILATTTVLLRRQKSTATAASPPEDKNKGYVSPHDWQAIMRDYGKSEAAAGSKAVEIQTITATVRSIDEQGSRYSRKIRKQGRLPGVLYGPGRDGDKERYLVTVERREIEKQMRRLGDSIASTVFDLKVGDNYTQRVLIRDLDRDPGTAIPTAVNFLRYRPGYPVAVPICFVNEELCLPLKRGGMLLSVNRFVTVSCEGETIPEMLLVDLTGVHNNQKVGIERVSFPEGVQPFEVREDYVLGVVKGKNLGGAAAAPAAEEGK